MDLDCVWDFDDIALYCSRLRKIMTSSVNILNVEQAAKAMLEKGIDGIYLCTLDELHDFVTHVFTLEEREKQKDFKLVNF